MRYYKEVLIVRVNKSKMKLGESQLLESVNGRVKPVAYVISVRFCNYLMYDNDIGHKQRSLRHG